MKSAEIRSMSLDELNAELVRLTQEQFNLRFQVATGQLSQTHRIKGVRKDIARIKTISRQAAQEQKVAFGGSSIRVAHSGPVHAVRPHKGPDRANTELPRSDIVENELMQAFRSLSARSIDRSAAIESLLRLGRQHQDRRVAARSLQRRLASIIPALVEELFDVSESVRWSAAYALVALRAPSRFRETEIPSPTPALASSVCEELGRFLGDRPGGTLSNVRITGVELHGVNIEVTGMATVLTRVPVILGQRGPTVASPGWVRSGSPELSVEITDRLGLLDETFPPEPSTGETEPGELISRSFAFTLPANVSTVLAVHVILNERRIAVHHIDSVSLLSD